LRAATTGGQFFSCAQAFDNSVDSGIRGLTATRELVHSRKLVRSNKFGGDPGIPLAQHLSVLCVHAKSHRREGSRELSSSHIRSLTLANQRRSQRILLSVRVGVAGIRTNGRTFNEETSTLVVNAHGCLILLNEPVEPGQELTLTHSRTAEAVSCSVKSVGASSSGGIEVGIEFNGANPRFWRASFPPEDWTPQSPDAKPIVFVAPPAKRVVKPKPPGT
jgi:hypothetical protein